MLIRNILPRFQSLLHYRFGLLKFNLPDLGEKIKQGTIKKLYVSEGDEVTEFQKLADVASDKQFTEITASDSGIIRKIHFKEEDVCQVGQLFLEIEVEDANSSPAQSQPIKQPQPQKQQIKISKNVTEITNSILATPYVRGLIKKNSLDIAAIKGSGENGRILESDIDKHLKKETKIQDKPSKKEPKTTQTVKKMSSFEKGMQKSMTYSNQIPHLYLHEEFDVTETQKMRKTIKGNQTKVTLMGILIKTFSLALKKYPIMNATYEPQKNQFQYTIHPSHNISIAIDSPNGLVVPNIKNVQDCTLVNIQEELEKLRHLSAQAKLTSRELMNGTICLSNIGTIGGINACPLILPPQVCIVAIGRMQKLPRFQKDQVVAKNIITVSYGCDHRVVDGATVARFSNEWKKILENPYLALAEMH